MKKNLFKKQLAVLVLLFIPCFVLAVEFYNPIAKNSIEEIVEALALFLFKIAWALIPLMILIGAFYILTAMGNPERVTTGKKIIFWTIVGTVILLLAGGLPKLLENILGS